jgi:thiamine-phosphate pyrophosphorylase
MPPEPSVLRILDANRNRAREGLRVVEEYARFVLDDPGLSHRLKAVRHGLREAVAHLEESLGCPEALSASRDTPGDVGTGIRLGSEADRGSAAAVARAGVARLTEALRALEEYGKVVSGAGAARFERLRYEVYAIEPALLAPTGRRERLRAARLYVIVTESLASADALTAAREAVAGGADVIQMREKEMEDGAFHGRAEAMARICREGGALFLVNDRPHIATLVEADGIHVGQGDLPAHLARRCLGPGRILGRSTNAPDRAEAAVREGADYLGVGPVWETRTKAHRGAVGLGYVRWAAANVPIPFFAIGSVKRQSLPEVLDAGARRVAVCTAIIGATDIAAEAAWFRERLDAAGPPAAPPPGDD